MHSSDDLSYLRGYEWRIMVEARKRNPSVLLSALAWTFPGFVGAGTSSPWTNVTLTAEYLVSWLRGARDVYNLTLDYINADMNERGCVVASVQPRVFSLCFVLSQLTLFQVERFICEGVTCRHG
jgi:hypothetical protein